MGGVKPLIVIAVLGAAQAAWRYLRPERVYLRRAARQPRTPIAEVRGGWGRVTGTVRAIGQPLKAPATGRACLAHRVRLTENQGDGPEEVGCVHASVPFWIEDETGCARVEAREQLRFAGDPMSSHQGDTRGNEGALELLSRLKIDETSWFGSERKIRYEETILEEGALVSVVGFAAVELDRDSPRPGPRALPMLPVLRPGGVPQSVVILAGPSDVDARESPSRSRA
jgi:hypothetical protein